MEISIETILVGVALDSQFIFRPVLKNIGGVTIFAFAKQKMRIQGSSLILPIQNIRVNIILSFHSDTIIGPLPLPVTDFQYSVEHVQSDIGQVGSITLVVKPAITLEPFSPSPLSE